MADLFIDVAKEHGCEQVVVLDFETYYDTEYSLSKMTTPQYVDDPLFEVIGVGITINERPIRWFTGRNIREALTAIDWDNSLAVAHNGYFDFTVLAKHYHIHPKFMYCTMMGARPHMVPFSYSMGLAKLAAHYEIGAKGTEVIHAKGMRAEHFDAERLRAYGDYCMKDVHLCRRIFRKQVAQLNKDERTILHLTMHKAVRPRIMLNQTLLSDELQRIQKAKAKLLTDCGITNRKDLMSNNKFAELLKGLGVEPPTKVSPTSGRSIYAFAKTDPEMKLLAECGQPQVEMLVQARIGHKSTLEETRIGRLLVTSRANHGRVPWPMVYYGARTGRFSGYDKLNMQNLPKGTAIRKALYAPEGHKLVVADLSQIEARVLAVMAGQEKLIAGFRAGDDVYRSAAADIYNKLPSEVTDEERFVGKTAILGLGYGCGSTKFRTMLGTKIHRDDLPSGEMCFNIVQNYRTQFGAISDYWRRCDRILRAMEGGGWTHIDEWLDVSNQSLLLPQGRVLYYPEIHTARTEGERWGTETLYRDGRGNWTKIYGGKLCENIVQAVAQIIMRDIELRIHTLVGHAGIVAAGQLHDELIYCVPSDHAEKFALLLKREMTRPPEWMPTLPMNCTIAIGDTYDEAK